MLDVRNPAPRCVVLLFFARQHSAAQDTTTSASHQVLRLAVHRWWAQEQIGFDRLLMCSDADLAKLGLRIGVRVKILGKMRGWAASELAHLS